MALEFKRYVNENGGEIEAAVVTDDDDGHEYRQFQGGIRPVYSGDVLATTGRPDEYEFVDREWFNETYREKDGSAPTSAPQSNSRPAEAQFDPSEHSATEVNAYLSRDDISDDEYARVVDAEEKGRNRKSAIPA